ncbi:caspase family protein [Capilliphycus salinus ALCB114379]|uniref:caspase family protein n=1 Tax=Capilliphycus salinus TaxID=2768948 RepID=UPI0039A523A7
MTRNLYALLVGIDNYRDPVPPLKGCVNDVMAIAAYLQQRITQQDYQLHLQILTEEQATRSAIINSFKTFLTQAESEDIALFYYSGHGSQEESPPEFWVVEPDRLDETLVCWDSRTENGWDLADKELAHLIAQVSQKNPHLVIILDCCHSAGGARSEELDSTVRWVAPDRRQRPLESFIVSPSDTVSVATSRSLKPTSALTKTSVDDH